MFSILLEKVGFRVEKKVMLDAYYNRNMLFRLIAFVFPRFRSYIFIVARKKNE